MIKEISIIIVLSAILIFGFISSIQINPDNMFTLKLSHKEENEIHRSTFLFENKKYYIEFTDMYLTVLNKKAELGKIFLYPRSTSISKFVEFRFFEEIPESNVTILFKAKMKVLEWNKEYLTSFDASINLRKKETIEIPFSSIKFEEI